MNLKNTIIKIIILAAVLVLCLCPGLNPLLSDGTKASIRTELQSTFGTLAGESTKGAFTPAKLIAILAVIAGVWLLFLLINLILK